MNNRDSKYIANSLAAECYRAEGAALELESELRTIYNEAHAFQPDEEQPAPNFQDALDRLSGVEAELKRQLEVVRDVHRTL